MPRGEANPPGQVPRVLLTEPIDPAATHRLDSFAETILAESTDEHYLVNVLENVDALIVRSTPVTADMLEAGRSLRVVGRHGVGLENIDVNTAQRRGIAVVNTPGANAEAVAEYVMAAATFLTRRLFEAKDAFVRGRLPGPGSLPRAVQAAGLLGRGLPSTQVAVIGLGAIGSRVAIGLRDAGAHVRGFDPGITSPPLGIVFHSELRAALEGASLVTLHAPLTDATRGLIGRPELDLLARGATVINTARSGLINGPDLLAALETGAVGYAVVDTFDPEPPPAEDPLLQHPRVFATPHVAGLSEQSVAAMSDQVVAGVVEALRSAGFTSSLSGHGAPPPGTPSTPWLGDPTDQSPSR